MMSPIPDELVDDEADAAAATHNPPPPRSQARRESESRPLLSDLWPLEELKEPNHRLESAILLSSMKQKGATVTPGQRSGSRYCKIPESRETGRVRWQDHPDRDDKAAVGLASSATWHSISSFKGEKLWMRGAGQVIECDRCGLNVCPQMGFMHGSNDRPRFAKTDFFCLICFETETPSLHE